MATDKLRLIWYDMLERSRAPVDWFHGADAGDDRDPSEDTDGGEEAAGVPGSDHPPARQADRAGHVLPSNKPLRTVRDARSSPRRCG